MCGGNSKPEDLTEPTNVEISLVSVLNNIFLKSLSEKWKTIFQFVDNMHETNFGHYEFHPQQAETETIIELNANFKLFNQHDLSCKIIYSLETIEKLLFFEELLNDNIVENTFLETDTLKNTKVDIKSIIGETSLALSEIQNIEIGDVILLENQKLTDPVKLIVDENLVFNATPITINDKEVGVQILNTPLFENHIKESSKPLTGPFITSGREPAPQEPIQNNTESISDSNDAFDMNENIDETEIIESEQTESEVGELETNEIIQEESPAIEPALELPEEPENESQETVNMDEGIANDDFSWDDLDDE